MIEYINIKNYQSHVDTRIELSSGITAITGLSMNGKTAIKRAFEWLRTNRPLGFRFNHRYNDEPTEVEIGVDGHVLKAVKSNKALDSEGNKALYSIMYPDGTEKTFSAFGTDVPKKVREVLGVTDISVQDQLDAYLLVISSSGEIAKTINKITGLDIGDLWLKQINQVLKDFNKDKARLQGEVDFLQEDVKKYEGVDSLYREVQTAALLEEEYSLDVSHHNSIIDSINRYNAAEAQYNQIVWDVKPLQDLLNEYETVSKEVLNIQIQKEKITDAMMIGENIKEIQSAIQFLTPELEKVQSILDIREERKGIHKILMAYNNIVKVHSLDLVEYIGNKDQLKHTLLNLGQCHFCGNKITKDNVANILENL